MNLHHTGMHKIEVQNTKLKVQIDPSFFPFYPEGGGPIALSIDVHEMIPSPLSKSYLMLYEETPMLRHVPEQSSEPDISPAAPDPVLCHCQPSTNQG